MEELDYWRLCEELNIVQAALLLAGEAPVDAEGMEKLNVNERPRGYEAAKTAITHALKNYLIYEEECRKEIDITMEQDRLNWRNQLDSLQQRSIKGQLFQEPEYDINGNIVGNVQGSIDLYNSTIEVESLKQWLAYRGFRQVFFFPEPVESVDFLDSSNPRYAPKLAAAVRAWQAVTDAGKKSPKQALDKWLREHAVDFGLTNDEGKPIEQAIEECSKVANWNPKGGATKTPT